jgi:hypothetical protein
LRVAEAAAIAGLNPETLRRRIRRGELPAWGSPRRVALNDVLQQFVPEHLREVAGSGGKGIRSILFRGSDDTRGPG